MAFDIRTAQPLREPKPSGGFDMSTAQAVTNEDVIYPDTPLPGQPAPYNAPMSGPTVIQPQQERSAGDVAKGIGEAALTTVTGATGGAAGSIYGTLKGLAQEIRSGQFGTQEAADRIERMAAESGAALTYAPRGEAGQEYVQNIAEVAAPLEALTPMSGQVRAVTGPAAARVARGRMASAESEAAPIRSEIQALESNQPNIQGVTQVATELSKKSPDVSRIAQFDPKIIKAAQDLGFTEIPPSVAAGNAQFRDIAQGMASISGSEAKAQYGRFMESLANKADEIIKEGGGDLDKPAISARYRDESQRIIDDIGGQESNIYDEIRAAVTPGEKVDASGVRRFVDQKVNEFGGYENLPPEMKRLHGVAYRKVGDNWVEKYPTYAEFDLMRRGVGQAIGKKSGPFADAETGTLKEIYGALKENQRSIVDRAGVGELQDAADALTIKRKAVEDSVVDVLGKNLSKDLMPQMAAKITGLPKGNVESFNKFISGVPDSMRREVVVSALNDLMRGTGADQKGLGAARFVGFMNDLERSPTAKAALYRHLPEETRKAMNNLQTLATGVYKANKENITTGKISQFFPEQAGFVSRLMGGAKTAAIGKAAMTGIPGAAEGAAAAADAIGDFLRNTTPKAQRANEFIASPAMQELIKRAVRDGVVDGNAVTEKTRNLEKVVKKSKKYQQWADTLDDESKGQLAEMGVIGYLMAPNEEQ